MTRPAERRTRAMSAQFSEVRTVAPDVIATATLAVATDGVGFYEITREVARFLEQIAAAEGVLFLYLRHTSASLVIQENADPDVAADLVTALERLAPADAGWTHEVEGPDDMPAHVKTMVTGVSLHVPVVGGVPALGRWQGIFVAEHRVHAHQREVVLQFAGRRAHAAEST